MREILYHLETIWIEQLDFFEKKIVSPNLRSFLTSQELDSVGALSFLQLEWK